MYAFALLGLAAIASAAVTTNGQCGPAWNGDTCEGSAFGNCCSQFGYCGSTIAFCNAGCQTSFGSGCNSQVQTGPGSPSYDGSCGGDKGYTCPGSGFGMYNVPRLLKMNTN